MRKIDIKKMIGGAYAKNNDYYGWELFVDDTYIGHLHGYMPPEVAEAIDKIKVKKK